MGQGYPDKYLKYILNYSYTKFTFNDCISECQQKSNCQYATIGAEALSTNTVKDSCQQYKQYYQGIKNQFVSTSNTGILNLWSISSPCSYQSNYPTAVTYDVNSNSVEEAMSGWRGFNQNPNGCVDPFSCNLFQDDCDTLLTNTQETYIQINSSSPFAVTVDRTIAQGWSLTVCYKCISAQNAGFGVTWQVSLTGSCSNNLQNADSPISSTSALTYQLSPNNLLLTSTYLEIFKEVDSTCPSVNGCNLFDSTCNLILDSSYSYKVEIQSVSPWMITQYRNVAAQYSAFQMCVKCVSDIQKDGLTFLMTLSQSVDCSNHLMAADTPVKSPLVLEYSSTENLFQIASGWSDGLIKNIDEVNCGAITSCQIYLNDEVTILPTSDWPRVTMGADPWPVYVNRSDSSGIQYNIKYKCFSSTSTSSKEIPWTINFNSDCSTNVIQQKLSAPSQTSLASYSTLNSGLINLGSSDTIFENSVINCAAITQCVIFQSDCQTSLSLPQSDYIAISAGNPWTISQKTNIETGYMAFQVCYKCVSADDNDSESFVMTLSLTRDCSNHIELASPSWVSPLVLTYSAAETNYEFISGWKDIFKNDYEAECGAITSCSATQQLCDDNLPMPTSQVPWISFDQIDPWKAYVDRSITDGFIISYCYKCLSSRQTMQLERQELILILDCSNSVQVKSSAISSQQRAFYTTSGLQTIGSYTNILELGNADCQSIDSCVIFQLDCSTPLFPPQSQYVTITGGYPWTIKQLRDVSAGYLAFTICYKCTSPSDINGASHLMTFSQIQDCSNHILDADSQQASQIILPYTGATEILATGYLDKIFKLENPTDCGYPSSCKIGNSNCMETNQFDSFIWIEGNSWAIKANQGIPGGWTATFCYFCESPNQSIQRTYIWDVQQYDCSSNFEQNDKALRFFIFNFNQTASMKELYSGWKSLFVNKNMQMCPDLSACQIFDSDCKTLYEGKNIIVGSISPWALEVVQNVPIGWNQTFCYGCSSPAQIIVSSQITIQQMFDCSSHLVDHYIQKENFLTLPFDKKNVTLANGWSDEIFENLDPVNCGKISSCELLKEDCQTQLDQIESQQVIIGSKYPWELSAVTTFAQGWNLKTCYKCFSDQVPLGKSFNWHIQQVDCSSSLMLIDESSIKELIHPYRKQPSFKFQIKKWDKVFKNLNSVQCPPITSCGLFKSDCQEKYEGGNFIFESDSPWSLKIRQNDIKEWTEDVCYKCKSAASSISYTMKFTQTQDPSEFLNFILAIEDKEQNQKANNSKSESQNVTIQEKIINEEVKKTTRVILKKEKYFTARIKEITANSIVKILFSQIMMDQENLEDLLKINSKSLQVILDNKNVHIQSWSIVKFIDQTLVLKLNISDPLLVSQDNRDSLIIQFINPSVFKVKDGDFQMEDGSKIIKAGIQKQMKYNIGTDVLVGAAESIDSGMNSMFSIQAGLNIIIAISIAQILNMFHPLQIMVFESMLKIQYPANATFFSSYVSKIINLDVLDPDFIGQTLLDYSLSVNIAQDPNYEINEKKFQILIPQIQDQGYESYHPILNLGGIFIIMNLFVAQIVLVAVLILLFKCSKALKYDQFQPEGGNLENEPQFKDKCQKFFYDLVQSKMKKMVAQIFFTSFIVLTIESVIQLTMASYLFTYNKNQQNHNLDSETPILNFFTWFTIIYCYTAIIMITLLSIYIINMSKNYLNIESFKIKFDYLYKNLNQNDMISLSYSLIFLLRRYILCYVFLVMQEIPAQQIQLLLLMNLVIFIYIGNVQPFKLRSQNRNEMVNEFLIVQLSLQFVIFTPFVPDRDSQYDVGGFMYIGFMMTSIVFNFQFLFRDTFRIFRMLFVMCYKRLKRKYEDLWANDECYFHKIRFDLQHSQEIKFNDIFSKYKPTIEMMKDEIPQIYIKQNVPQIFIIPINENTSDRTLLADLIKKREKIYKLKKEKMFELKRTILKQKQIDIYVANSKSLKFSQLKISKLCDEEKSQLFYKIKAALHIEKKFSNQTLQQDLTTFVINFLAKRVLPVTKFSIQVNMMKEIKWDFIHEIYLKQNISKIIDENIEDHHLFSLTYDKNLSWKSENECFNLSLPTNGFGDQLWTSEEVNELVKIKTFARKQKLNEMFKESEDKDSALRKIQRLYIIIDKYQQGEINMMEKDLDPNLKQIERLETIINLIKTNYKSQMRVIVNKI